MFNVNDFLIKFKKLTPPNEVVRVIFSEIIFNLLKININKKDILLKNNILYIKTTPIIKNEIFLHKNEILKKLKEKLKEKTPKDIF